MTTVLEETPKTDEERRAFVQASATRFYRRKVAYSRFLLALLWIALAIAFVPLVSIVYNVLRRGLPFLSWSFLTTPQQLPNEFHQNELGGISNAITGSILVFGLALVIAIPIAVVVAIALFESKGRIMGSFRRLLEVMVGMPSILFGIFAYAYVVKPLGYVKSAYAGSIALAILMIPLMAISCEVALRAVPGTLVEAALALGAKPSRVMRRVLLPYAMPRMWTGIMLSLSRGVGETAPILFVIGTSLVTNWSLKSQQTTLPTATFADIGSQYAPQQNQAWGIALVLITAVFIFNVASRILVARANKGRA